MTAGGLRNAVALAVDDAMFPAAAFAATRLAALNNRADTDVFVFTDSARELERAPGLSLPFAVRPIVKPGVAVGGAYFRLFLPHSLGRGYARTLYLDTDTWAEDARVFGLFDLDMGGEIFAGVRDYMIAFMPDAEELRQTTGTNNRKYLNTGVLLIDNARFEADRIVPRFGRVHAEVGRRRNYFEQTPLNFLLQGAWTELSPAFNTVPQAFVSFMRRVFPPAVVHFAGKAKPWTGPRFTLDHPARAEMERWFPTSPWKDFLPRFFGVSQAMAAEAEAGPVFSLDRDFPTKGDILRYLRETRFADVEQGLTAPHLREMPDARP